MLKMLLLILPLLTATGTLTAQALYNVRVGTFQDVKASDFEELDELGFVYGTPREGQLTDVYLGNYSSREKADEVVTKLKGRGFRNAAPFALPVGQARPGTYIQLALRGRGKQLDWRALEQAGKLYVDATDGVTRVVTGPYTDFASAAQALSDIRGLGYADAFTKTLDAGKLIPVGTFETGIKKALIPIQITQRPTFETPTQDTAEANPPASPSPVATAPAAPPPPPTNPTAPTTPQPAPDTPQPTTRNPQPAPSTQLPSIDVATKRHSAANLQRVLKEKGYYDGSIDGYYGQGTKTAYQKAWNDIDELQKYRTLAAARPARSGASPTDWPEMRVTTTIADELAAGLQNTRLEQEMTSTRSELFNASKPLSTARSKETLKWEDTVWANLNDWAEEDPLHAQILSALRVAYYQSQTRLEAMYQQRGLSPIEARNLATAALQNILSAPLDRFL